MSRDLVIIGAGGFGRETLDVVRAINDVKPTWRVLGFIDECLSITNRERLEALSVPYLGDVREIPAGTSVAVAIGNPTARQVVVDALAGHHPFPALIHPTTIRGSQLCHGEGMIVLGGVCLGTNVRLGDHVHLNAHAVVGHDAKLHDFVSVNPNATISGEVEVGPGGVAGASCVVLQGLSIASDVRIGAGAVVTRSVTEAEATIMGVPAR